MSVREWRIELCKTKAWGKEQKGLVWWSLVLPSRLLHAPQNLFVDNEGLSMSSNSRAYRKFLPSTETATPLSRFKQVPLAARSMCLSHGPPIDKLVRYAIAAVSTWTLDRSRGERLARISLYIMRNEERERGESPLVTIVLRDYV